jgi:hypothetical protein
MRHKAKVGDRLIQQDLLNEVAPWLSASQHCKFLIKRLAAAPPPTSLEKSHGLRKLKTLIDLVSNQMCPTGDYGS